jgi:hypothetical protein
LSGVSDRSNYFHPAGLVLSSRYIDTQLRIVRPTSPVVRATLAACEGRL